MATKMEDATTNRDRGTKVKRIALFIVFAALIGGSAVNLLIYLPPMGKLDSCGIPVNYYHRRCIIPLGMPVETWLTAMKWSRMYEVHVWNCSQMAAFTEWALENCGYEAEIVLTAIMITVPPPGNNTRSRMLRIEGRVGHAYVRVKIGGVWHRYETTSRRPLTSKDLDRCIGETILGSIYSAQCFGRYVFAKEWAWWAMRDAR